MKKDKNLVENETNKNEEQKSIGLCLGMCFGLSIGMSIGSLFDKITIGIELYQVYRFNSDSIYSKAPIPLKSPFSSFVDLKQLALLEFWHFSTMIEF